MKKKLAHHLKWRRISFDQLGISSTLHLLMKVDSWANHNIRSPRFKTNKTFTPPKNQTMWKSLNSSFSNDALSNQFLDPSLQTFSIFVFFFVCLLFFFTVFVFTFMVAFRNQIAKLRFPLFLFYFFCMFLMLRIQSVTWIPNIKQR